MGAPATASSSACTRPAVGKWRPRPPDRRRADVWAPLFVIKHCVGSLSIDASLHMARPLLLARRQRKSNKVDPRVTLQPWKGQLGWNGRKPFQPRFCRAAAFYTCNLALWCHVGVSRASPFFRGALCDCLTFYVGLELRCSRLWSLSGRACRRQDFLDHETSDQWPFKCSAAKEASNAFCAVACRRRCAKVFCFTRI